MAASATVSIDLQANTASASRGLDGLQRQLQSLQVQARAASSTLGGAWSGLKVKNKFTIGSGLALASLDTVSSLLPAAVSDSSIGKALTSAAQGATRLGTMLAPLGPAGIAAGAAVGGVSSAIRSLAESARAAKKEIEAAAKAERARGLRHNDYIGEEAWRWKNADAAERGKIQSEARERIAKARFKLASGMSISESDVYGVANWDRALALELGSVAERQNGGQTPEGLRVLLGRLRSPAYEDIFFASPGAKRDRAFDMLVEAEREGRAGRDVKLRAFDKRYDAAYAASLKGPEKAVATATPVPDLTAILGGGPSADSLSSIGLGFTGTRRDSQETLELLRRIADSSDRAARKDGGLK